MLGGPDKRYSGSGPGPRSTSWGPLPYTFDEHLLTLTNDEPKKNLYISRMYPKRPKLHPWTIGKLFAAAV